MCFLRAFYAFRLKENKESAFQERTKDSTRHIRDLFFPFHSNYRKSRSSGKIGRSDRHEVMFYV